MALAGCDPSTKDNPSKPLPTKIVEKDSQSWFHDISAQTGIDFRHEPGDQGRFHLAEIMGGGIALFDYDNDGDLDVYFVNGNQRLPKMETNPDHPITNRLYRREADGRYVDVTTESGLGDGWYGMGVALGDIDNDGDTDVYVTNFGRDSLYLNLGNGRFLDVTESAGVGVQGWSCSATFLDYDRDGFLDLYVTRYIELNPSVNCFDAAGRRDYCGPKAMPPVADVLLHNNGDGTFTDVSKEAGITTVSAAGLGVVAEDFNEDGWIDIYVANDAYANQLWINQANGTFVDDALMMGAAYNINGKAEAGMGVVAADFDNDQDSDLFMTHLNQETNTFYRNEGADMGFSDVTGAVGLGMTSVPYTGFGTAAIDVELDGDLDLFVVNGRVVRGHILPGAQQPMPWSLFAEPNLFYLNSGRGIFALALEKAAAFCDPIEITRGLVAGDLDDDGDVDLIVSTINGPPHVYRNDAPRRGAWLTIRAIDPRYKRDALGARITVLSNTKKYTRTISHGFSYLSAGPPLAYFGLDASLAPYRVRVRWPDGNIEMFNSVELNRKLILRRGSGSQRP